MFTHATVASRGKLLSAEAFHASCSSCDPSRSSPTFLFRLARQLHYRCFFVGLSSLFVVVLAFLSFFLSFFLFLFLPPKLWASDRRPFSQRFCSPNRRSAALEKKKPPLVTAGWWLMSAWWRQDCRSVTQDFWRKSRATREVTEFGSWFTRLQRFSLAEVVIDGWARLLTCPVEVELGWVTCSSELQRYHSSESCCLVEVYYASTRGYPVDRSPLDRAKPWRFAGPGLPRDNTDCE